VETRDSSDGRDLVESQRVSEMAFDKPQRFLGRIHKIAVLVRSVMTMRRSRGLHLIVLALAKLKLDNSEHCSASRKLAAKALLATSTQLCILALAFDPTAQEAARQICLSPGQHVREDDHAHSRLE
jgi:hypothetical protein